MVLDAGDYLFPDPAAAPGEAELARAELLLEAAVDFGTAAINVGDRDLANGLDWLVERAGKTKAPFISANLARPGGKRPFPAHRLVEAGEARVGVTGVWLPESGTPPDGLVAGDPVAAAREQAAALRKAGADVVIVLAHGTKRAAAKVAAVEGVDLVIPAHEKRAWPPEQPAGGGAYILGAGYEGRSLLHVDLAVGLPGPLVDGGAADRARREIGGMQVQLKNAERRLADAKTAEERAARSRVLEDFRKRAEELKARAGTPAATGNIFHSRHRQLSRQVPDDEVWAEKLRRVEEKYPSP